MAGKVSDEKQAEADAAAQAEGFQGAVHKAQYEAEVALPVHYVSGDLADMKPGKVDGQVQLVHSTACGLQQPQQEGERVRTCSDEADTTCTDCLKALKKK